MQKFYCAIAILLAADVSYVHGFKSLGIQSAFRSTREKLYMTREVGKCKFFDTVKGYGFITRDGGGQDVFVHQSAIFANGFRSLATDEPLEFEVKIDEATGREQAINVTGPNGAQVKGAPRRSGWSDQDQGGRGGF